MAAFTAAASPPTGASAALAEPQHEQGWTDLLAAQGVHPDLIEHMRKERIINASRALCVTVGFIIFRGFQHRHQQQCQRLYVPQYRRCFGFLNDLSFATSDNVAAAPT